MTVLQLRLVKNYATLVMGGKKTIEECPENLREAIKIEIAEREIAILE